MRFCFINFVNCIGNCVYTIVKAERICYNIKNPKKTWSATDKEQYMQFVWAGDRKEINAQRNFYINTQKAVNRLEICAVDNYQVFFDGQFVAYGPERTAAGYSRKKVLTCDGVSFIEIKVISHGVPVYICDFQDPFFAAELFHGEEVVYTTQDFACRIDALRDNKTCRYSRQRGFVEKQFLQAERYEAIETYPVEAPKILGGIGDTATYETIDFSLLSSGEYQGFSTVFKPWWEDTAACVTPDGWFDIHKNFLDLKDGYKEINFVLPTVKTGFFQVEVESAGESEIYVAFDEILHNGVLAFGRSACNDLFVYHCKAGQYRHLSAEPYTIKYIKVIYKGDVKIKPTLVLYENTQVNFIGYEGDEKIVAIIDAAKNTFAQNAVDLFTDCAGRERAGWLCDSFFTGMAERLFTGENKIEKNFLENYILAEVAEIPEGMLPMCFPSQHDKGRFIPNWAMWFVVELHDYLKRTKDSDLIAAAKSKVYGVIEYFKAFKNEYGLLNNLESWIFVEWSIANTADYIKGVNFPSNMLYSAMLRCAGELYADEALLAEAEAVKKQVLLHSFNGEFFVDNAETVDGKIVPYADHISETCQYYALFLGITDDSAFATHIKENFGPNRKDGFDHVGKSNAFIGNYLRLLWLCDEGEYEKVLNESIEYFYAMSQKTGTLWEHDLAKASCNHGFASAVAVILLRALLGYEGVEDGKLLIKRNRDKDGKITVWQN